MFGEVNLVKEFLNEKFNGLENVKAGVYAVPKETSKGSAFMRVEITPELSMKDFTLFKDEALTESWY